MVAASGMMLVAVPALNMPIVTTADSVGSISRLTNCWRLMHRLGGGDDRVDAQMRERRRGTRGRRTSRRTCQSRRAARPAWSRPCRLSGPASRAGRKSPAPSGRAGRRARPPRTSRSAPPPPSSAGCQISFTQTGSSPAIDFKTPATPSSVAVCPSCPQACIRPGACSRKAVPVFSRIGSASMSARRATQGLVVSPSQAIVAVGASVDTRRLCDAKLIQLRPDRRGRLELFVAQLGDLVQA